MKNKMRVVLPKMTIPVSCVVICVMLYAGLEAFHLSLRLQYGEFPEVEQMNRIRILSAMSLVVVAHSFAYGAYRVAWFHPAWNDGYRAFLLLTPWTPEKSLPFGPVYLVWQDLVVLLVFLLAAMWHPFVGPLAVVFAFVFGYVLALMQAFLKGQLWAHAYLMIFGFGLLVRVFKDPVAVGTTLACLLLVGLHGLKLSLIRLRQDADKLDTPQGLRRSETSATQRKREVQRGWPFVALQSRRPELSITYSHGIVISLLAGWCAYAALAVLFEHYSQSPVPAPQSSQKHPISGLREFAAFVLLALAFGSAVSRLVGYLIGHRSPISLWDRVRTGRWLIPSYDRVLVAPLVALLVAAGTVCATIFWNINFVYSIPAAVTAVLFVILKMGPSVAEWQLTSECRISRPSRVDKEYVRV